MPPDPLILCQLASHGFCKYPDLVMELPWKNPEGATVPHELVFWQKALE